jgi:hypothetical protein
MSSKTRFTLLALALLATAPMALEAQKARRDVEDVTKSMMQANNNFRGSSRGSNGNLLTIGATQNGSLDNSDERLDNGAAVELWGLELRAGDIIIVTMNSSAFDTQMALIEPRDDDPLIIDNDDALPDNTNSAIVYRAHRDGAVLILATSYGSSDRGAYAIQVTRLRQP